MTVGELIELLKSAPEDMIVKQSNELFAWDINGINRQYDEDLCEEILILD